MNSNDDSGDNNDNRPAKPRFRRIAAAPAAPTEPTPERRQRRDDERRPARSDAQPARSGPRGDRPMPRRTDRPAKSPGWQPPGYGSGPSAAQRQASAERNEQEGVRISKLMAERGLCSRREADGYIEQGLVYVDGQRVTELGTRADPQAIITLAPGAKLQQERRVTILINKPVGYVSGQAEDGYEPASVLVTAENQFGEDRDIRFTRAHLRGLAPAGRLDIDSTGLLVLTQDGRIARKLIGEDSDVEKEYLVRVEGDIIENGLKLLNHGLSLDGKPLRPAKVSWSNEDQLRFVLREGKKRQIRRMCELVGLHVVGLKRVRIG
ncbi:MAG TPA: pseudouridine synthase, partial [Rhodocyclaceae bacterium]|nr:pseudouridine synthase [Rhodocyclaceae bacterium]